MFRVDSTIGESKNPMVTAAVICAALIQYRFMPSPIRRDGDHFARPKVPIIQP